MNVDEVGRRVHQVWSRQPTLAEAIRGAGAALGLPTAAIERSLAALSVVPPVFLHPPKRPWWKRLVR